MSSIERQELARISPWIDRWGYLGVIALIIVLVLTGLHGSEIFALETAAGFARYMWVVTVIGLGFGVGRPVNRYMHHRYGPWVAPGTPRWWRRYKIVAAVSRFVTFAVVGAAGALMMLARANGLWPWRP